MSTENKTNNPTSHTLNEDSAPSSVSSVLESQTNFKDLIDSIGRTSQQITSESLSSFSRSDNENLIEAMNQLRDYVESFNDKSQSFTPKMFPYLSSSLNLAFDKLSENAKKLRSEAHDLEKKSEQLKKAIDTLKSLDVPTDLAQYSMERELELKQSLQVTYQGVLALNVLIENGDVLLKAAEQARSVTLPALKAALDLNDASATQTMISLGLKDLSDETTRLLKTPRSYQAPYLPVPIAPPSYHPTFSYEAKKYADIKEIYRFRDGSKIIELVDLQALEESNAATGFVNESWHEHFVKKSEGEVLLKNIRVFYFIGYDSHKKFNFAVESIGEEKGKVRDALTIKGTPLNEIHYAYLKEVCDDQGFDISEVPEPKKFIKPEEEKTSLTPYLIVSALAAAGSALLYFLIL